MYKEQTSLETVPVELQKLICTKLPVNLPLQLTIPMIFDDDYWKKCCLMRWTTGQIGTFCKNNGAELFKEELPGTVEDIMFKGSFQSRVQTRFLSSKVSSIVEQQKKRIIKSWKQLYLEINLDEFLETLQPQKNILQELKAIYNQPTPDEKSSQKNSELVTLRELHKVKEAISEEKELQDELQSLMEKKKANTMVEAVDTSTEPQNTSQEQKEEMKCLHSHLMRPNVNYYLLHCNTLTKEDYDNFPIDKFKAKLQELYDGIQSQGTSRLNKITNDDDIFTFYESAIQKKEPKSTESKMQFWLLNSKEHLGEADLDIQQMFEFIHKRNQEHLLELCALSKDYIAEICIRGLKEHVDIQGILHALPNLEKLKMEYSARNVGMTFDLGMLGIRKIDCQMIAKVLSDPQRVTKLATLILSENLIDDEQAKIITSGLYQNSRITYLDLSRNKIGIEGCKSIAAMLKVNKNLKTLHLCDNEIQTDGGLYLGACLKFNSSLTELNVGLNKIGDSGAISILSNSKQLNYLNISNNVICDEAAQYIIHSLLQSDDSEQSIPALPKRLDLSGNFISPLRCEEIALLTVKLPQIEIDTRLNQDMNWL